MGLPVPGLRLKEKPLRLRFYGDETLRTESVAVREIDGAIRDLGGRMVVTMAEERGIGLAAPQVGHNLRLITVGVPVPRDGLPATASPGERLLCPRMPLVLLNPEVLLASARCEASEEGCLSVPDIHGEVTRPATILFRALTLERELIQVECGGLLARCIQHEIDHLNGVLFVDRLSAQAAEELAAELQALRERTAASQLRRRERQSLPA